jgi:hypothetical protein
VLRVQVWVQEASCACFLDHAGCGRAVLFNDGPAVAMLDLAFDFAELMARGDEESLLVLAHGLEDRDRHVEPIRAVAQCALTDNVQLVTRHAFLCLHDPLIERPKVRLAPSGASFPELVDSLAPVQPPPARGVLPKS